MFCINCKKQINGVEKFCVYCGTKIVEKKSNDHKERSAPSNNYINASLIIGVVSLITGGVLTWMTYRSASDGGTYIVFWGLIIYGVYKIFSSLDT